MRQTIHRELVVALVGAVALVQALAVQADVGRFGELVGLSCAVGLSALVAAGLGASGRGKLAPADRVTLTRAVLTCGVAAMVADAVRNDTGLESSTTLLVVLAAAALLLDAVDGPIARRTGTASPFGARFDMECDAFLILVLAVHVSRTVGWWVLLIGAARYLLILAQRLMPWLAGVVPARRWRKAVAAYTGAGLTVAASRSLPPGLAVLVVGVALVAIALSFGTQALELWPHRRPRIGRDSPAHVPVTVATSRTASTASTAATAGVGPDASPASVCAVPGIVRLGGPR
ncbi:CDP-alcohol phosphatidyltransferase family protein [Terrabacter lapilli]|uniref:CDP-alcohol phosphatidyltransferase family protein n=1 Tax=Terrabacter lapilli TaxID=436231 RepID=A0ABN2SDV9_9MICO